MDWYIGFEWIDKKRGLFKRVLDLQFKSMEKPLALSTLQIKISNCSNNLGERESYYLTPINSKTPPVHHCLTSELGSARNPIDCYIEILLQQFIVGETSVCHIETQSGDKISFEMTLEKILDNRNMEKLDAKQVYDLALSYKENGVAMFKLYPTFAFNYFIRACKIMLTYQPLERLTVKTNGIDSSDMKNLLVQIQTNIAACLLQASRYEDVLYHTNFVDKIDNPSEKCIYRRALALYNIKEFDKALRTLERIPKYEEIPQMMNLYNTISNSWKRSNAQYKEVIQRMFS